MLPSGEEGFLHGKKALIVDDAYFMRNLIKKYLKEAGYEVVGEAKNGKEGIMLYFKLKPDFVTMDISMPEMDGIEATRQILSKDPNARIIAVTGVDKEEVIQEILTAGARACLKKPFQSSFLINRIEKMFAEETQTNAQEKPTSKSPVTPAMSIATNEAEEDFFASEISISNQPKEENAIVIENNEDQILFPEEDRPNREKYALSKNAEWEKIDKDENRLPQFPKEEDEPFPHQDARNAEPEKTIKSYIEIRPPKARPYSHPEQPEEHVVPKEPVLNAEEGEQGDTLQKKGFLTNLNNFLNKFLKK